MKNISTEDKLLLVAYGAVALAYATLFVIKFKHFKH
jgi:hypothetical protein